MALQGSDSDDGVFFSWAWSDPARTLEMELKVKERESVVERSKLCGIV